MSFNKPFRAVPITLGYRYRAKARRQARAVQFTRVRRVLGVVGGVTAAAYVGWNWPSSNVPALPSTHTVAGAYFARCADARAAGVAPIYRGQPGYRPELDRDGDGLACEPYRGR